MSEEDRELANLFRMMRPKNICICKAVSEATLIETIHQGAHTVEDLVLRTSASTKCGSCSSMVRSIFNREMMNIHEIENNNP